MISPIYATNPALAEKPYFFPYLFQGLNDVIMSCKFTRIIFLEEGRSRSEGSKQTEVGGPKEGAPRDQVQGPRGPTSFEPRGPVCDDPSP